MIEVKRKIIIGIDHGYGNIKTANHCFRTAIDGYDKEPVFTKNMLVFDGRYYLIGEGHKEFIGDKSNDNDFYLLTLAAIAEELRDNGMTEADVIIAAGLPLTWTSGQKRALRAYLLRNGNVSFIYQKVKYSITISDVLVYPQGYAAIAPFSYRMKGVNLIADIGNGTMNVLYMVNGLPQAGKMFTEKLGTYQFTLSAREMYMRKTHTELNDAVIDEFIENGSTSNLSGENLALIKEAADRYVDRVFKALREHGYDESSMMLYFVGGGAHLVENNRTLDPERVKVIDDICANAKGYEYMARLQLTSGETA